MGFQSLGLIVWNRSNCATSDFFKFCCHILSLVIGRIPTLNIGLSIQASYIVNVISQSFYHYGKSSGLQYKYSTLQVRIYPRFFPEYSNADKVALSEGLVVYLLYNP